QRVAGYSLGQADILRRAMGKKDPEVMRNERSRFIDGAKARDYPVETAEKLWEYIEPFAGYAFNKSHAFCYAFVAYQTAYLKANYPVEWMAAVLTTDVAKPEKIVSALGECRQLDIEILLPSINYSQVRFTVERLANPGKFSHGIRFGLAAIKNVGEGAVESVVAEREKNGPFKSLDDFCSRVDLRMVNKRVIEALVKCGAMDEFGPRERVLAGIDACMGNGQRAQKAASTGQVDMFSMFGGGADDDAGAVIMETPLPVVAEVGRRERLMWEKEAIGVFLSDHPFMDAARWFASSKYTVTSAISADIAEKPVTVAGIVAAVRRITTRKGDTMVVATLEDLHGSVEVVGFPRTFQQYAELWREDAILVIQGKVDARDDRLQIIAEGVEEPAIGEDLEKAADEDVRIYQPTVTVDPNPRAAWRPKKDAAAVNGNGNGHANGSSNGNGSNGNGHSNGNGSNGRAAAPEIVVNRLRLVIPRTDNEAADINKIQRLDFALGGQEGQSPCEVIVVMPEGKFRVSDPEYRVRFSADLKDQLQQICGAEYVVVERG
ncbi:MAG: OB-fold nucleic acid binding domain-containing protein, partial [Chloroflexota bacterium]